MWNMLSQITPGGYKLKDKEYTPIGYGFDFPPDSAHGVYYIRLSGVVE